MSLPANFLAAIQSRSLRVFRWLEIEGLPYAYGSAALSGSFFSARAAAAQFSGIKSSLIKVPPIEDQELDVLDGVPRRSGVVEAQIGDHDLLPTLWTGVGNVTAAQVAAETSAAATSIVYVGSGAAIPSSGTIYIGTETITYTGHDTGAKTLTGCSRGRFRSTAAVIPAGAPIGLAPYTLSGRRAWLYLVAVEGVSTSISSSEPDKVLRFSGIVTKFRMDTDPNVYVLSMESLERELDQPCFRDLRTLGDDSGSGIHDGSSAYSEGGLLVGSSASPTSDAFWSRGGAQFEDGEIFAMRVDDEIFRVNKDGIWIHVTHGGLFSTARAAHKKKFSAREVVAVTASSTKPDGLAAKFASAPTTAAPAPADHPLMILLQVLLSTGTGSNTGHSSGRNYDVLPASWGMGLTYDRVDVDAIEALVEEFPDVRIGGVIEQPINFLAFLKSVLRPLGCYATITVEGKLVFRYLRPPLPDETTRLLTDAHRKRGRHPGYDANLSAPVQTIEYRYGIDIADGGKPKRVAIHNFALANFYTKGKGRKFIYDAPLFYTGKDAIPGEPRAPNLFAVEEFLLKRADFFQVRFGRPPPVVTEIVDLSFFDVELGALVEITSTVLPNPATGTRGVAGAIGEVIAKRIDEEEKLVELSLLMTGYQLGSYRFIAPTLAKSSSPNTTTLVVQANVYTEAIGGQTDLQPRASNGALVDAFRVGQVVTIWNQDWSVSEDLTIASINFGTRTIVFTGAPSTLALADATTVTYSAFGSSTAAETDVYAFLDNGHLYFPG